MSLTPAERRPSDRDAREALAQAVQEQKDGLLACVHCGFCLPACPTYRRLGDEADSPRGRLYLMQAVVEGRLDADSDAFHTHIDRCLGCRACEPVCPSGVAYGHLLELARQTGRTARKPPLSARLALHVIGAEWLSRPAMFFARLLRATKIPALVASARPGSRPRTPRIARLGMAMLAASAPPRPAPRLDTAPSPATATAPPAPGPPPRSSPAPPSVAILAGCVQAGLFARVNRATARVLRANGYQIVPATGLGCCGALHAHSGDLERARAMARKNIAAFEETGADFLAMNASGCGAAVADYGSLLRDDPEYAARAARVSARTRDISQLLAESGPVAGAPIPLAAASDAPCHLLHAQGIENAAEAMLGAVPQLHVVPLRKEAECCGGAGIYGLTQRETGSQIGFDKVRDVIDTGAKAVVTANPGCMMQIGAHLRLAGHSIAVWHPVELLDESYRRGGLYGPSR